MSYQVGIDLGTTYTAAAVHRDGVATIFSLGSRSAAIPSVVLLREDGEILTGDAAARRAASEPERVVREFKRRLGDPTPIIVGATPYSAEALSARLLEAVIAEVERREAAAPSRIVITHPANWGNYKRDLLEQAVQLAGFDRSKVGYITEPEAAAFAYAAQERVEPGEVVAVYDLGGGTFDAAILRRTTSGFSIIGHPEGIERLGGVDFDAAVFAHVTSGIREAIAGLDENDPASLSAVLRLRQDCVEAKEALSSDTDATVPILLPNLQTEVRITRAEFEAVIRPTLVDSIEAMRRAIRSADLETGDVSRVLLVGGSSRIPLISLLVSSELGRPVAVDAHPKHAIALGAAHAAGGLLGRTEARDAALPAAVVPAPEPAPVEEMNRTMVAQAFVEAIPKLIEDEPVRPPKALPMHNAGPPPGSERSTPAAIGGVNPPSNRTPPAGQGGAGFAAAAPVVGGVNEPPGKAKPIAAVGRSAPPPGGNPIGSSGRIDQPSKARPIQVPPGQAPPSGRTPPPRNVGGVGDGLGPGGRPAGGLSQSGPNLRPSAGAAPSPVGHSAGFVPSGLANVEQAQGQKGSKALLLLLVVIAVVIAVALYVIINQA